MKKFFAMLGAMFAFSLSVFAGNVSTRPISREDGLTSTVKPQAKIINGHKFIDLGLPSGLLWGETNVGASSATDYGDYFAWGETKPKTTYRRSTYKWGSNPSKYNYLDNKTTLEAADDAATVNWGTPCRMPDSSEFEELYNKCYWSWKSNNGTSGYLVTGSNGNTIFLPASGGRSYDGLYYHGLYGYYWSRTLFSSDTDEARCLDFDSGNVNPTRSYGCRFLGFSVRPVAGK